MKFVPEAKGRSLERKDARVAYAFPQWTIGRPYREAWDIDRAMKEGVQKVIWVFRAGHAIADNQARLPIVVRDGEDGPEIEDHELLPLLNYKPNDDEFAYSFRYRLSWQLLVSKKGAFVEVVRTRGGSISALYLLDPRKTFPVPGKGRLVDHFSIDLGAGQTDERDPADVAWIKLPHPFDPLGGMTPLESAGISIDVDVLARLYNRTFLQNDGRPGGIVGVKGDMDDDVADELEERFNPGVSGAGRVTVIEAEGLDFVDTAVTPRDAQYSQGRTQTKEDILGAFGTPESIALGNASQRTYENVDAERFIFWESTMLGHCGLLGDGLNVIDQDPSTFLGFDFTGVDALQRIKRATEKDAREEVTSGTRTLDSYLELTGREPTNTAEGRSYWFPMGLVPVASDDGESPDVVPILQAVAAEAAKAVLDQMERKAVVAPFRVAPRGRGAGGQGA